MKNITTMRQSLHIFANISAVALFVRRASLSTFEFTKPEAELLPSRADECVWIIIAEMVQLLEMF